MQERRVTIDDVAKASGVSKSAVSYALNGKPGVSDATRSKVLRVAQELGWKPNSAARALSNAATGNVGMILAGEINRFGSEPWMMELIAGLGIELERGRYSLLIRVAGDRDDEIAILREWIATGAVDGMLLLNVEIGDPRIRMYLQHPEMPVLCFGHPSLTEGLPTMWNDEASGADLAVRYLHGLGHTAIARVAGQERLGHTLIRDAAFVDRTADLGIRYSCLHTDFTAQAGADATMRLLSLPERPTAIVYDNDVMAVAGMNAARAHGLAVPDDLSVISWDDSFLCCAVDPQLTAIGRDVTEAGRRAAGLLLRVIAGEWNGSQQEPAYEMRVRGSTADAPRRPVRHP